MLEAVKSVSREVRNVERRGDVLALVSDYGTLFLEPKTETIVRAIFSTQNKRSDKEKPGVIYDGSFSDWTYEEDADEVRLCLPSLTVHVKRATSAISYYDNEKGLIFTENQDDPRDFEEFDTYRLADVEQKTRTIQTADGVKEVVEEPLKVFAGKSYHVRLNFELQEEALYGLGQQEKGFGSLRGRTLYIHQANRKIAASLFTSTKGYGILVDTYSPMIFNDNHNGTYIYVEADQELDYYFIAGESGTANNRKSCVTDTEAAFTIRPTTAMNNVIKGYRLLTGKAALLPKWAFGYVQSQERYETQEEILEVARRCKEEGFGLDCIVLDWMSWKDNEWGQKSYDEGRFPEPVGMIKELHDEHVHFMISIWPTMATGTDNHNEFAKRNLFLPACTVYNALSKEARELYFDQLKRTHFSYGTDAWWCDSSEPITPEWNHSFRMEEGALFQDYCKEMGLRVPYEYTNSYPLYHAMGIYENQRKAMAEGMGPEKRVCNLTRSSFTGQQRYGTVMWSGDTAASWETLRDQVAIGLHFSASGMPFWTMDIGAFFVKKSNTWYWNGRYDACAGNKGYCELYVRWYQFGAFLPMFRAHGTDFRREPWTFEGKFKEALRKANKLRYSLMPYIYSEAGKVWRDDNSMIKFLAFDFGQDKKTWNITDQFMFGDSLMVCPVLKPMYYDQDGQELRDVPKARRVYFPEGCDWYDFYTGEKYEGGSSADVEAPLDVIPVFVRGGSLVPVREPALSTKEQTDAIDFKRFAEDDAPATYTFYDDDGDGYDYESGNYTYKEVSYGDGSN